MKNLIGPYGKISLLLTRAEGDREVERGRERGIGIILVTTFNNQDGKMIHLLPNGLGYFPQHIIGRSLLF